jgi:hypothetical protein
VDFSQHGRRRGSAGSSSTACLLMEPTLTRDCIRAVVTHVHDVPTLLALRRVLRSDVLHSAVTLLDLSSFFMPRTTWEDPSDASWFDNAATRRKPRNTSQPRVCLLAATFQLVSMFPACAVVAVRNCIVSTEDLNRCLAGIAFAKLLPPETLSASDLAHQRLHDLSQRLEMNFVVPAHPLLRVEFHKVAFRGEGCLCCRSGEERLCLKLWKALGVPKGGVTLAECTDEADGAIIATATKWFEI